MAMAQSMSVSDRRKMFELESPSTSVAGSDNVIHDSLRKTKPTLTKRVSSPNITVRSTTKSSSSDSATTPVKKGSIFSRKNSSSSSDSKKVNRASSDADLLESKRSKYRNLKSMDQASPKHTKSNEGSPTHTDSRRESARKRREPPKPPTQTVNPKESPIKRKTQDSSVNGQKSSSNLEGASPSGAKPRGEKPARPPSPKNVVRDKDLEITLSDGGCVSLFCVAIILYMV